LRSADVPNETRKALLGHRNGDITTHYSAPELEELIRSVNKVCREKSGKCPALKTTRLVYDNLDFQRGGGRPT
jgi:hypothetical protein